MRGRPANFMAVDDDHRVREVYGGDKFEKLKAIRGEQDPENIFGKTRTSRRRPGSSPADGACARRPYRPLSYP